MHLRRLILRTYAGTMPGRPNLTPRELSVLIGLSQGLDIETVAAYLQCSRATAYRTLGSAGAKLGLSGMVQRSAVVERARSAGHIVPGMRLLSSGIVALTTKALARGSRLGPGR